MNPSEKKVLLIGAGLVGSLLSNYLTKHGYKVEIFERRPDMRKDKISAGRSINLALSERGWRGLNGVGLSDAVRKGRYSNGRPNDSSPGREHQLSGLWKRRTGNLFCITWWIELCING
jgi:2-polyprenyl-6-methoxyphenol hydroxylase-like FAD-dependent oxidoreductase